MQAVEAILRQPRRILFQLRQGNSRFLTHALLGVAFLCCLVYGLVAGTFSGGAQLWAAPVKIAGGLFTAALICLPSLYIFACLSGAKARLSEVTGLVAGLLALTSLLLIGFAPVVWVFSQSTESTGVMGSLHLVFWAMALYFGVRFLWIGFRCLEASLDTNLRLWMLIFVLVTLQMMTSLRPIIGSSSSFWPAEKKFFVAHWFDTLHHD
jgi:hypothetical protein